MDAGDDVVEVGSRSLKERNEQGFAQAIDLSQDDPSSDEDDGAAGDACTVAFHVRSAAHGAAAGAVLARADAVSWRGARFLSSERGLLADAAALALALEAAWSVAGTERVRVFGCSTALRTWVDSGAR